MKRIICLLLIMTMVLATNPVYAVAGEISSISSSVDILEKEVDDNGEITKSLSKIDKALYLYEKTDDSIISIGVYDNKLADVGIKK